MLNLNVTSNWANVWTETEANQNLKVRSLEEKSGLNSDLRHVIKIKWLFFFNFSKCPPPVNAAPKYELTIILSIHSDHRHHLKEDFGLGVDEPAAAALPAGSLQIEAVDINSLRRRLGDVVLHPSGHLVTQHHAVQGPALVGPSDLLQVQGQINKVTAVMWAVTSAICQLSPYKKEIDFVLRVAIKVL